jgi:hypothetical protein
MTPHPSPSDRIRRLVAERASSGTAFQLVLRRVAESVRRSLDAEKKALSAAISLAQEEALSEMVRELEEIRQELEEAPEKDRSPGRTPGAPSMSRSGGALPQWWFVLAEASEMLNDQIAILRTLSPGQEREAPSRQLCSIVLRILRNHSQRLQQEAESWMN